MRGKLRNLFIGLVFLAGVVMVVYPTAVRKYSQWQADEIIDSFERSIQQAKAAETDNGLQLQQLYEEMQIYNKEIYQNGQTDLKDPFFYEAAAFDLYRYGITDNIAGYVSIPRMNMRIPLYFGATSVNLASGAGILGYTSVPVGGTNTNTVLAAHRGYRGVPMFREIEALQTGDRIYITNFWETIIYEVTETKIILPTDIQAVRIQEGKDMVTLITCHPYTKNIQRYLVFCERSEEQTDAVLEKLDTGLELENIVRLKEMSSSQRMLFVEKWVSLLFIAALVCVAFIKIIIRIRNP